MRVRRAHVDAIRMQVKRLELSPAIGVLLRVFVASRFSVFPGGGIFFKPTVSVPGYLLRRLVESLDPGTGRLAFRG